jgi:hypothetical protein
MSKYADANQERADRLRDKTLRTSCNYCNICGRQPDSNEEHNYAPLRWWDPDDGWKIGTLCHWCHDEAFICKPMKDDYAYPKSNGVCDVDTGNLTDEDPSMALE